MAVSSHDFTRPPRLPPALKAQVVAWLNRTNAAFAESVAGLGLSLQSLTLDQNTGWPLDVLGQWPGKPVGFRMSVQGTPAILAMPNRLAQCLVAGLLGDSAANEVTDRELTPVELDLCELIAKTFQDSLTEAWISESPLQLALHGCEPNLRRSKLFRPSDPIVVCRSSLSLNSQEHLWSWIVRQETLNEIFGDEQAAATVESDAPQKRQMESLVRGMKLPLMVKLGQVQLTAPQLAELRVGDVVVLHQRTSEPLKALISGRPAFLGWPGQIGTKQAFQIEAELAK